MADNRYTGDVDLVIVDADGNSKTYILRADWPAVALAQEATGNTNALRDLYSLTAPQLAAVTAALLAKHHPEVKAEDIIAWSPPIVPLMSRLNKAILFAYSGADGVKEVEDKVAAGKAAVKSLAKKKQ